MGHHVRHPRAEHARRRDATPWPSFRRGRGHRDARAGRSLFRRGHRARRGRHLPAAENLEPKDLPLTVVVPAFILSEMKTAFQMGFLSSCRSWSSTSSSRACCSRWACSCCPPATSTSIKVLVFVLVDGWRLVTESVVTSFFQGFGHGPRPSRRRHGAGDDPRRARGRGADHAGRPLRRPRGQPHPGAVYVAQEQAPRSCRRCSPSWR